MVKPSHPSSKQKSLEDPTHPFSRQTHIDAFIEVTEALQCRSKIEGFPPLPKAKSTLGLDQILWIQVMMGDLEGMKLTLELGANANYQHKGKSILNLANAFAKFYGEGCVKLLESYGAKLSSKKIKHSKSS